MSELTDLGARLSAVGHLPDPVLRAAELVQLQAVAAATIAAATDAAAAEACEQMPTAEVAARLGVSEHQIRRRLTAHRARIGRPGRPGRPREDRRMYTIHDLAAAVGMARTPERVARWAGCLTPVDPRTGRIPMPWHGKGMGVTLTRAEADQLIAQWHREQSSAERLEYISGDPEDAAIADRYRP